MKESKRKKQWYWENRERLLLLRKLRYDTQERVKCEVCKLEMKLCIYRNQLHTNRHALRISKNLEEENAGKALEQQNDLKKKHRHYSTSETYI
jgi:hypothetical protein